MIEHTPNANGKIYMQAQALETFFGYTFAGAMYVLRGRDDILAVAIRRAHSHGMRQIEDYLKEMS